MDMLVGTRVRRKFPTFSATPYNGTVTGIGADGAIWCKWEDSTSTTMSLQEAQKAANDYAESNAQASTAPVVRQYGPVVGGRRMIGDGAAACLRAPFTAAACSLV